ncbi:hypothetical protein [Hazenella coriacea]|uniref:Uncharacterized protein n=1 Tax=Hazenella coriacea TaxID=1179467 RepID=A0A4R3L2I2_9BACL|nr:hypothetical protein [Hazenella coriacea]TCS93669.1 hypothetical protein EDD58_106102 [Hazenella coriacea]
MLKFNKEEVRKILLEELRFPKDRMERSITAISKLDSQLQPLLDQWLKDRKISHFTINGVSLDYVYKYFEADDFIDALITMEMFAKSDHLAKRFLKNPKLIANGW